MHTLILASGSPQRSALLSRLHVPFVVIRPNIEEKADRSDPMQFARTVSRHKAETVRDRISGMRDFARGDAVSDDALVLSRVIDAREVWILGTDTLIDLQGDILGKPSDAVNAREMLERLSGVEHDVITAMALLRYRIEDGVSYIREDADRTSVRFGSLTETEIGRYIDSGDWEHAAGAYRIQSLGEMLVESIRGSYTNVVGLPLRRFYGMLIESGFYNR